MGILEIRAGSERRSVPLFAQTLIGSGPACTWVIGPPHLVSDVRGVPGAWLELRWDAGRLGWQWRELARPAWAPSRTLGSWQPAGVGLAHGDPAHALVVVTDVEPPGRCLVRLSDGHVATDAEMTERIEDVGGEVHVVDRDGDPLREGAVFAWGEEVWRLHLGVAPLATGSRGRVDLTSPGARLTLSMRGDLPTLIVTEGRQSARVEGAALAVLVPYVRARLADRERGYLKNHNVIHAFRPRNLRNNEPAELRGRVRELLEKAGIDGGASLWEGENRGSNTAKRVSPVGWTLDE